MVNSPNIRVAVDGPVGAGKSTLARECAKRLGFIYIDTGALYRSVGLFCKENNIDTDGGMLETRLNSELALEIKLENNTQRVYANGIDVSEKIREPEISMIASKVSAIPCVRAFLLDLQRGFAKNNSVIMDGRDIGTVILPNAEVKIFLTASPEKRARRRFNELIAKGADVKYEDVLADLNKRDYDDSNRAHAPLKQAEDALVVDTTDCSFDESAEKIISIIKGALY